VQILYGIVPYISKIIMNEKDQALINRIQTASFYGDTKILNEMLIDKNFIANEHHKLMLYNALIYAIKGVQIKIIKFLLKQYKGIISSRKNKHEIIQIVLEEAQKIPQYEEKFAIIIEMLVHAGADITKVYTNLLKKASQMENIDTLRVFIKLEKHTDWEMIRADYPSVYEKLVAERFVQTKHSCTKGLIQASGTCYYNAAIHGILLSPQLYHFALLKLHEYIEHLKKKTAEQTIHCSHLYDTNIHLKVLIQPYETNIQEEVYDEYILNLGYDKQSKITPSIPIIVTKQNMDEVATFMIMKLIYFYKCNHILQTHLYKTWKDTIQKRIDLTCPNIRDYIQLLASFTIKIHEEEEVVERIKFDSELNNKYKPTTIATISGKTDFPLHLEEGGNSLSAFKTMLKYIYGYEKYKKNVKLLNIFEDPFQNYKKNIKLLNNFDDPLQNYKSKDKSKHKIEMPELLILHYFDKNMKNQKQTIKLDDMKNTIFLSDQSVLFNIIEINGNKYQLDHISIRYTTTNESGRLIGHVVMGTMCNTDTEKIPVIVDSYNPKDIFPLDWRDIGSLNDSIRQRKKYELIQTPEIYYICYVNIDKYDEKYQTVPISDTYCEENRCEIEGGGNNKYTYNKKQYKKYTSTKGTYILVDGRRRYLTPGGKLKPLKLNNKNF